MNARNVTRLGQVFTPPAIVEAMLALRQRAGHVLEPSCGDGAFFRHLPGATAIEFDARFAPPGAVVADFFAWQADRRFDTILGNPPYVRNREIDPATRACLPDNGLDRHANLYLFFIDRCLDLLAPGGELIFITPRGFLKATGAYPLNRKLYALGTITHAIELGDKKSFDDALPNCLIWRFERDDFSRRTCFLDAAAYPSVDQVLAAAAAGRWTTRHFTETGGQLAFSEDRDGLRLEAVFSVRVGAVSGADAVFSSDTEGTHDFVCSHTERTGRTRRMVWCPDAPVPALWPHKARLLARRIKPFDESNWWQWGRGCPDTDAPRIYVNHRTRRSAPFFLHPCTRFDGAVLALFPRHPEADLGALCAALNAVDWHAQGFVCDGRYIFTQRSLSHARLPGTFACPKGP